MNQPLFAHRPPSTGVHLLSDPLPEIIRLAFERSKKEKDRTDLPVEAEAEKKPPVKK